jgi:predicted metal-dependent enzyme (double-stranded beta helix superfamily)
MDDKTDTAVIHELRDTVTPFRGDPAANLRRHEIRNEPENKTGTANYGLQPGTTVLVDEMAQTLHAVLKQCQPHAMAAAAKASLRGYLCESALLSPEHQVGSNLHYNRHLLYADPGRQFSILAIVWQPGQCTPIHGHTAWGAVGVWTGNPYCEVFDTGIDSQPRMHLRPKMKLRLHPGDLSTVQPGIDDVHRIGNDSYTKAVTVHVYGRDLLASPGSINITFN